MGYNPGSLCVGNNKRASVTFQSEALISKTYPQVQGKGSKDTGKHDDFRNQFNAILEHHRRGLREQVILGISLHDSQEKWGKLLYHELNGTEPVHYLHKIQNDHPDTDNGGHLFRTMGNLI